MPFSAYSRYLTASDELIPWEWASEVCQSIAAMRALYGLSAGAWDGYDLASEESLFQAVNAQWPHLMVPYGAVPGGDWTFANRATIASDELGISGARVGELLSTNAFTSAAQIETYDYWNCLRVLIERLENPVPWPLASQVMLALQERAAVYDRDDWPGHDLSTQEGVYLALSGYQYPHWGRIAPMWDTDLSGPTLGMGLGWPSGYASTLYPPTIHTPVPLYHEDYWLGIAAMLPHMLVAYLEGTKVSRIEYAGAAFDSRFESPPVGESCDSYYDVEDPFTENVVAAASSAYAASTGYPLDLSIGILLAADFTAFRRSQVESAGTWAAMSVVESVGSVEVPAWCASRGVEWTMRMGFERAASSGAWYPPDGILVALNALPGSENFSNCGYDSSGGVSGYRWEQWLLQLGAGGDTLASCPSLSAGSGLTEIDYVFALPSGLVELCSTFDMTGGMSPWAAFPSPSANYGSARARLRGPALLIADVSSHLSLMT